MRSHSQYQPAFKDILRIMRQPSKINWTEGPWSMAETQWLQYKQFKKLRQRTIILFWLRAVHGTALADGTSQTSTWSPSTFKYLPYHGTVPRPVSRRTRTRCQVSAAMMCQNLLHVGVYRKSLASQVLPKRSEQIEITWHEVGTVGKAVHSHLAIAPHQSEGRLPLFGSPKKHLAGKQIATDADMKQAVASWLQTLDTHYSFYAEI